MGTKQKNRMTRSSFPRQQTKKEKKFLASPQNGKKQEQFFLELSKHLLKKEGATRPKKMVHGFSRPDSVLDTSNLRLETVMKILKNLDCNNILHLVTLRLIFEIITNQIGCGECTAPLNIDFFLELVEIDFLNTIFNLLKILAKESAVNNSRRKAIHFDYLINEILDFTTFVLGSKRSNRVRMKVNQKVLGQK